MTPSSRRGANKSSLAAAAAALCWLAVAISQVSLQVAQTVQVHDQQQQQQQQLASWPAKPKPSRLELKFQSELDESKIVKHSGQQQVFKCQVRLAPAGGADGQWLHSQPGRARLKSSSRWLTTTTTAEETMPYASPDSSTWDGAALAPALAPLKFNVSELTIEWLKNGRPLGVSYEAIDGGGDKISVVNVTLKTRHQQQTLDKMPRGRAPKPRLEIKNTLNGQQLKLTSRLRIGQMRDGDAGQFQCVARARFVLAEPDADHSAAASTKRELVEQSLESASAHLIVWPTGASANHDSIGDTGRPRNVQPDDVPFRAIKQQDQQQGRSLDSDDEGPPVRFEPQPGQRVEPPTSATSLFEDDEDLFRLDSGELISGDAAGGGAQSTNDNEQEQQIIGSDTTNNDLNGLLVVGVGREKSQQHAEAHLDWILGDHDGDGPAPDNGDQSGLSSSSSSQQPPLSRRRSQPGGYHKIDDRAREVGESLVSGGEDYSTRLVPRTHSGANEPTAASTFNHRRPAAADGRAKESSSSAAGGQWLTGAGEYTESSRTRSKLAKLVHTIVAAESSCYTGAGELYRGNAAHSADQRVCLNWLQVRASLAGRARDASSRPKSQQQQQHAQRDNQTITQADYLSGASLSSSAYIDGADHNHCRNPNGDPRGPWCFVAYSEPLDGVILTAQSMPPPHAQSGGQRKVITHRHRVVRVGLSGEGASAPPLLVVVGPCAQVISCSEYLWLYVVAPPLGLLIMLTCLASFAVRSIRRSRCNAVYQRQVAKSASSSGGGGSASALSLGLGKLIAQNRRPPRKRLVSTATTTTTKNQPSLVCCGLGKTTKSARRGQNHATRKTPSYLDDDIFEIVDDIDWSDGPTTAAAGPVSQATTMSPKSVGELFNLHASASEGSHQSATSPRRMAANKCGADELLLGDWHAQITHSKSTNPVFSEQALDLQLSQRQQHQQAAAANLAMDSRRAAGQNKMSKSRSQAGPMFATLRCHVRNTHQKRLAADSGGSGSAQRRDGEFSQSQAKKSSSFIEPRHEYSNGEMHRGSNCAEWMVQPAVGTISSSTHSDSSSARTGHLISCAASSCDSNGGGGDGSNALTSNNDMLLVGADSEGLTLANELPRLDAANVTLAYEAEPIYEGKFSQVLRAYLRQNELDLTQATGRIGAQVAVCSLKQQAAMDESVFHASGLRLHNLNHLNILKLLGYVQSSQLADAMGDELTNPKASKDSVQASGFRCSLVYDMAHLIDLSDWLKEQCKDAIVARDDEISGDLSLKQNLTCVAKQVALALDYLHDKNIVYKDLACRNCFLDVTRMLVKLASFNVEPEFVSQEESPAYGHSGVPGPSNSKIQNSEDNSQQELLSKKLSLKSMVRPKYLLDYYVIDSRPSECQLLPLSWIPLESILFNKFNKQTDIWSFGCLLYELFSLGEVAYFGYSSKQVIDAVRSNMMPPQPLLCPNGIYKLMCKCLSDIPTLRPNIKHVYEQLNLYSGQCSSFLNHHLCMI